MGCKGLLLFRKRFRGINESREYPFSQYIELICLVDMVEETLGTICLM